MARPRLAVLASALLLLLTIHVSPTHATWCVARSDASDVALQTALDYACGSGADCAPIQASGLCYLPNTVQAHVSYAFNSYYQRRGNAPGSCDFSGTATVAKTDPSYGSCVYPASASQAGGTGGTGTGTGTGTNTGTATTPTLSVPPPPGTMPLYGNGGLTPGLTPGAGTVGPITSKTRTSLELSWKIVSAYVSCAFVLNFI